jgi:hypothetical protein
VSRKHNTRHLRGFSSYPLRLQARGLGKPPKLEPLDSLRQRQLCHAHADCRENNINKWDCEEAA